MYTQFQFLDRSLTHTHRLHRPSQNVLLRNDDTPALADFGFAKCARTNHGITPAPKRSAGSRSTSASSAAAAEENPLAPGLTSLPDAAYAVRKESIARGSFSPPEYWRRDAPRLLDGRKADAYALGVLASFCLTFQGVGLQLDKGCTVAPPFPPGTPELAVDFVRACLVFEAAERPMPQDLLEHPWIADSVRRLRSAPPPPPGQSLQWWVPQPAESEASTPGTVSPDTEGAVPDDALSSVEEAGPTPSAPTAEGTAVETAQGAPDTPAADGQVQTPAAPPAPPAGKTDTEVRPITPAPLPGTEEQGTPQAGDIALLTDTIPCPQRPVRSHSHVISPSGKRTRSAAWLASPSAKRRLFSTPYLGDALVLDPLDSLGGGSALRAPEQASDSAFCSLTPMRLAHMQRTWSADGNPTPIESSPGTDPAAATQ